MGAPGTAQHALAAVRRAVAEALDVVDAPAATSRVVLGCSGGADSLALAAGAVAAARHRGGPRVHGVVVDHGLQDGSARQAARAAAVLDGLGVDDVSVVTVAVEAGGGPEAAARRARRAALLDAAAGAPILLGHTRDDQAETVLLGLGRGSGARSLAGMAPWDPPWSRPLLGLRRATTRAACAEIGLEAWDDPHNDDPRFTRVRVRHEALPLLEDVLGGGVTDALARTAAALADDDAALSGLAERVATDAAVPHGLDAAVLARHPPAVRRRVLRTWLLDAGATEVSDAHLRAVDDLVGRWRGQGPPALPGGLEVRRGRGRLSVRPIGSPDPPPAP